jgi:hypothetical protein
VVRLGVLHLRCIVHVSRPTVHWASVAFTVERRSRCVPPRYRPMQISADACPRDVLRRALLQNLARQSNSELGAKEPAACWTFAYPHPSRLARSTWSFSLIQHALWKRLLSADYRRVLPDASATERLTAASISRPAQWNGRSRRLSLKVTGEFMEDVLAAANLRPSIAPQYGTCGRLSPKGLGIRRWIQSPSRHFSVPSSERG